MDNNLKMGIAEFLQDALVKYSQGLIYWREQSNNENNNDKRAKECEKNIQHFNSVYSEVKSLLDNLKYPIQIQ